MGLSFTAEWKEGCEEGPEQVSTRMHTHTGYVNRCLHVKTLRAQCRCSTMEQGVGPE